MTPTSRPRPLTMSEAAERVGVSRETIRQAILRGEMVGWQLGRLHRVLEADLDAWVQSKRVVPEAPSS